MDEGGHAAIGGDSRAAATANAPTGEAALDVAVVIPARNAARFIDPCLGALTAAGVPPAHVVVVDDASSDDTAARAAALGACVLQLDAHTGSGQARNLGVAACTGDVILFVDADVLVRPDLLERIRAALSDPSVAAVFGSYDDKPAAPGWVSRYRNLLHHFVHQQAASEAATFWTGCGAVRRKAFERVGGFATDHRVAPIEDIDLGLRLRAAGWRIRLDRDLLCKHLKYWSLSNMIRTDVFHRALPWGRILLRNQTFPAELNLSHGQRVAVGLAGVALVAALAAPFWPMALWILLAAVGGVIVANRAWFAFLARTQGLVFAVAAVPLQLIYHVCAGVGLLLAVSEHVATLITRSAEHRQPAETSQCAPRKP
jgi:GT2 family glycosyltransferase